MTNKELQEKIARLEAELAEVKENIAALPKRVGGVFKPEYKEKYWFISGSGEVYKGWYTKHLVDHDRYTIGNCFPTEQAAEDTVRVLKLIQKARESQDGYVPDWKDKTRSKYHFYFESGEIRILILHVTVDVAPIFGYWEDESVCEQFIQDNRDELIWFFTEYRR